MDVPPFSDGSNSPSPEFAYQIPGTNIPLPPSLESSMSVPLPITSSGVPPRTGMTGHSAPGQGTSATPTVQIPTASQSRHSSLMHSSSESERWSMLSWSENMDIRTKEIKDERRYRISLQHEFHPSCELSLCPSFETAER